MEIEFDTLYARASNGKVKEWTVGVEVGKQLSNSATLVRIHGYIDGKRQISKRIIKVGKNVGCSNETTFIEQAELEAQSLFNSKKDEGYVEDINGIDNVQILIPMHAVNWHDQKHKIVYPCYAQPKLNGVKDLTTRMEGSIRHTSKMFKPFNTLGHLDEHLMDMMQPEDIFDGEIFHPDWTFQEIIRHVKKWRPKTEQLQYWVYDFALGIDFRDRYYYIQEQIYENNFIIKVPTVLVTNDEQLDQFHKENVANRFEGTMVRNGDGAYVFKFDTFNLQKRKDFVDEEFEIVGAHEGSGNDAGCVIFEVNNPYGKTPKSKIFSVRPKGTVEDRRGWFRNLDSLIGKELTVRYQEFSEEGTPIFPVGLAIRDYE